MNYQEVVTRIAEAASRAGRKADEVTLVAVSKTKSADEIRAIYDLGHRIFGENRAQELATKAPDLPGDLQWHFVGALQSNKARVVRPIVDLLHSMDRESLAAAWMKGIGLAPPVLVEVNLGDEAQKGGISPEDLRPTVGRLLEMGLDVRGLMAIPPIPEVAEDSRPYFARLRDLRDEVVGDYPGASELSMGMTDDFEVAIEEGASIIRVGRAIFGPRN